jgi:hypothetical protein
MWGKIYEYTWWGNGVYDNTIDWGIVYKDLDTFYEVLAENGDYLIAENNDNIILE